MNFIKAFMLVIGIITTPVTFSAVLVYEGTEWIGIDGVNVQGKTYNARFYDGSWDEVGGAIGLVPESFAASASSVLLHLFSGSGAFQGTQSDLTPDVARGCSFEGLCLLFTSYEIVDNPILPPLIGSFLINHPEDTGDADRLGLTGWLSIDDSYDNVAFVGWNEVTHVPLPAAVWLMGSGLLGLMGYSRKKKRQSAS